MSARSMLVRRVSAYLCLPACLPACLSVCLSVCLSFGVSVCVTLYRHAIKRKEARAGATICTTLCTTRPPPQHHGIIGSSLPSRGSLSADPNRLTRIDLLPSKNAKEKANSCEGVSRHSIRPEIWVLRT
ncbi:hypothetical protein BC567DRAFT_17453 [Phyllosticta citribraziliensis]